MKRIILIIIILFSASALWSAGSAEEGSSNRADYLARHGDIASPEEINVSSFISQINYSYPVPQALFSLSTYTGNSMVSTEGQEEVIVIGVQGCSASFSELPPLNIAFVIDRSGSMGSADKLSWVKDSFDVFVDNVRDEDFVSLVVFDSYAEVIFPSTQMGGNHEKFREKVYALRPQGGTNLSDGLRKGYEQVMANYREDYTNRVLFLTDGMGNEQDLFQMATVYRSINVNVSTIGLGYGFDHELMGQLARSGGGSSRFISDRETLMEVFGSGLGRMIVPVARNVQIEVELLNGTELLGTWAYKHHSKETSEIYTLPSVHLSDYETIIMKVKTPNCSEGPLTLARIKTSAEDPLGNRIELPSRKVVTEAVPAEHTVDGYSSAVVLHAGSMLNFAEGLRDICRLYHEGQALPAEDFNSFLHKLTGMTNNLKKELLSAEQLLDRNVFEKQLRILNNYIRIFGGKLEMNEAEMTEILEDREPEVSASSAELPERAASLFNEIILDFSGKRTSSVAVAGFSVKNEKDNSLCDLLDEMAETAFSSVFNVVERSRINDVISEQKLSLSDLVETTTAIEVGNLLAAEYIVTGTVIPMQSSVIIFTRIIHVESAVVESAAQIVFPLDSEVRHLLQPAERS